MRAIGVERDDVLTARLLEAGPVRATESGELLADQSRPVLAYDLLRAIARASVDDDDLVRRAQRDQRLLQFRENPIEILAFVEGREDQAQGAARERNRVRARDDEGRDAIDDRISDPVPGATKLRPGRRG